jgi:hypothetical protein
MPLQNIVMKKTASPTARRAQASTRRSSAPAKARPTRSRSRAPAALDLEPLLEEGAALAQDALKRSRFAVLADLMPSVVKAVGDYARRQPAKAAGLALGVSGLLYLGRAALGRDAGVAAKSALRPRKRTTKSVSDKTSS